MDQEKACTETPHRDGLKFRIDSGNCLFSFTFMVFARHPYPEQHVFYLIYMSDGPMAAWLPQKDFILIGVMVAQKPGYTGHEVGIYPEWHVSLLRHIVTYLISFFTEVWILKIYQPFLNMKII